MHRATGARRGRVEDLVGGPAEAFAPAPVADPERVKQRLQDRVLFDPRKTQRWRERPGQRALPLPGRPDSALARTAAVTCAFGGGT